MDESKTENMEDLQMFEQLIKRDFVARRGRNNRILMRSIMKNVFNEQVDEQLKIPIVINKGQSHYLDKYNKAWLGKRAN